MVSLRHPRRAVLVFASAAETGYLWAAEGEAPRGRTVAVIELGQLLWAALAQVAEAAADFLFEVLHLLRGDAELL
jgi:hypothetical protein